MSDYSALAGKFTIESAFRFDKGKTLTEWHCAGTKEEVDVFVVIYYYLGLIKIKYGETEYDTLYGDKYYLVGSCLGDEDGAVFKDLNSLVPRINIHQILSFLRWNYELNSVC